jgi:hypothetical protein
MSEPIKAWMCIGCGAIEAPQTCIGICQHRKVEFVHKIEQDTTLAALARVEAERDRLQALLRRMASVTPREDALAATLRAFQHDARALLAELRAQRTGTDARATLVAD